MMSKKKNRKKNIQWLHKLKFDSNGLIPAVAQDSKSGEVLMVAYMNRAALLKTIRTGKATYWSRSRSRFWIKGEESGNTQKIKEMRIDCDLDCVLIKINQKGGAACHTGMRSCFFRKIWGSQLIISGKKIFDPRRVYKKSK